MADGANEFLELIEFNLKHGTKYQKSVAIELLLRFLGKKTSAS